MSTHTQTHLKNFPFYVFATLETSFLELQTTRKIFNDIIENFGYLWKVTQTEVFIKEIYGSTVQNIVEVHREYFRDENRKKMPDEPPKCQDIKLESQPSLHIILLDNDNYFQLNF